MLTQKQKAVASTTAQKYIQPDNLYQTILSESMAKFQIGELLLYLQKSLSQAQRKKCWKALEIKLRRYYEDKASGRSI